MLQGLLRAVTTAGVGSITPLDLTGLIGWWDAQVFASLTLSGSNVTAIADQSGAGNNLTGVSTPTYGATQFNSTKPGIKYDSTGDDGLINSSFPLGTSNTLTLFGVFRSNDPAIDGMGTPARMFSYTAGGQTNDYDNAGSFAVTTKDPSSDVAWSRNSVAATQAAFGYHVARRLIITVTAGGSVAIYVDGVATTTAMTGANWGTSPGYFGLAISKNNSTTFQQFGGQIGEAGVATAWHDATTVAALDTYLKNKWGL